MKNRKRLKNLSLVLVAIVCFITNGLAQADRSEVAERYKWNLEDLYPTKEAWVSAKDQLAAEMVKISDFQGTLTTSASNLLAALQYNSKVLKEADRLYIYASMHADQDTRDMKALGMTQGLQQLFADFSAKAAYIQPEILSAGIETIEKFIKEEPKLDLYAFKLRDLFRQARHTLSEPEEQIMALSGLAVGSAGSIYSTFKDAEMPSAEVVLSNGEKVSLTSSGYEKYRALPNREDRKVVFKAFWDNYAKYKATFGQTLYGNIKKDIYHARARQYKSSLESSLSPNNIPVEVYHGLIDNVNKNLPAFHRYLKIKKRMLNVDTLRYLDMYAPVVKDVALKYTYEEAQKIVLESMKPLGNEYVKVVREALDKRWIDVYPTTGKQSGAYSNGAGYDVHPYILLNYNGLYGDVSTFTHELGHTMHSYLSNKTQPYPLADYPTFVAEVASTFNEVLLFNYIINTVTDDDVKLSLLMSWLDGFKGTLFRQTQFAEYELKIHEAAEKGQPLTGDFLSQLYSDIVKRYYGHEEGICHIDDYINMEWAFIPHFYYNFYMYQYSTSFTASISLAGQVMNNEEGALEKYIAFLSSGGSDYPIELLKKAGVDMTARLPFNKTIAAMNKVMDEIEKILDKKAKK